MQNHRRIQSRPRPRRALRAMTLIEITIVVVIIGMIATAVGVAVFPAFKKSQVKQAKTDTKAIQAATELYFVNGGKDCPSVDGLVQSGELKKGTNTTDPWGAAYTITCEGENVTVSSPGPDGQSGTQDDI